MSRLNSTLSQERLREVLHYDPETGAFRWLVANSVRVRVGDAAGIKKLGHEYARITIDGKTYLAHRLAWFYVFGVWPKQFLDHADMNRHNNRISNLREATKAQNMQNKGMTSRNRSGVKGVSWSKQNKNWQAQCTVNGKHVHLGHFETIDEAALAYRTFAAVAHGEFYRPSA